MKQCAEILDSQILQYSGGGQVVSMLAFYSNDASFNPAEVYIFL